MSAAPISALIVDDEHHARERLRVLLSGEPDIENVGECENGLQALAAMTQRRPDLVFLDVRMPDLDGLGVIAALNDDETPEVIFVTAHDTYMERAFELHAVDFLRKPYTNARFASALAHARKCVQARRVERGVRGEWSPDSEPRLGARYAPLLAALRGENEPLNLALEDPQTGVWAIVRPSEIEWISADASARVIVHVGSAAYRWRKTLAGVAETLDPRVFVRVHRSCIVNVNHIRQVKSLTKGEFMIQLDSGQRMDTGRTYRGVIERFLLQAAHASVSELAK